jgi:hypothetical protein
MSYEINNQGVITNGDDKVIGTFQESLSRFTYADDECKRFRAPVATFLKNLGFRVTLWEVAGKQEDPIPESEIPPQPKWNPKWGDKTPSYVRWLERYRPEEFKALYGVIRRGVVPVFEDGVKVGMKETWIAKRKTCLTDKVDLPNNLDPDLYDLNAE